MAHSHLPSTLRLPGTEKAIQLRFANNGYELTLFRGRAASKPSIYLTPAQMRQLLVELMPLRLDRLTITYDNRDFVLAIGGKEWARIPDVQLMKLYSLASTGVGECVEA